MQSIYLSIYLYSVKIDIVAAGQSLDCYTCTINSTSVKQMKVVSFSEARSNLKSVLDRVVEDADHTIITRRDAEDAVVMSLELFDSLLETVHLLKSPANAAHLERSIAQFKQRKMVERNLLDD